MTAIRFRNMRQSDVPAGLRLCRAAEWNQLEPDWEFLLASSPGGCRVAVNDAGDVVGSVATIRYGDAFSWVGMVLVDPAHRRAGIGSQLLREALSILDDMPAVRLDATPAGHDIYVPCGFREEYRLQRMQRDAQSTFTTPRVPRPMTELDLERVVAQDQQVFGANRRALLEGFRRRAPEYAWVIGDTKLEGYVFGRHGYAFEHIGPLVARDEPTARFLGLACLSACSDRPFVIDVPLLDSWVEWLESIGFNSQRPFIRMCRGEQPFRGNREGMFAIAGPEFG